MVKNRIFSVLLGLLVALPLEATERFIDVSKDYKKSYRLDKSDAVYIHNLFGEIKIRTWNKSEIEVEAVITVSARREEKARRLLDGIEIKDRQRSGLVSFETKLGENMSFETDGKAKEKGFSIDMIVHIPAHQELELNHEFGELSMGDYSGNLEINSKFGSVEAGVLSNVKRLLIEFSKANIAQVNGGEIECKFAPEVEVDRLLGDIELTLEFCGSSSFDLDEKLTRLDLEVRGTSTTLIVPRNFSAEYQVDCSMGSFDNRTEFDIDDVDDDWFSNQYEGRSGDGTTRIDIKLEMGQVELKH